MSSHVVPTRVGVDRHVRGLDLGELSRYDFTTPMLEAPARVAPLELVKLAAEALCSEETIKHIQ